MTHGSMPFKIAVVYYSRHGLLVTLANIIAAGARKVRPIKQHLACCVNRLEIVDILHSGAWC